MFFLNWQRLLILTIIFSFALDATAHAQDCYAGYQACLTLAPVAVCESQFQECMNGWSVELNLPAGMAGPSQEVCKRYRMAIDGCLVDCVNLDCVKPERSRVELEQWTGGGGAHLWCTPVILGQEFVLAPGGGGTGYEGGGGNFQFYCMFRIGQQ